MILLNFHIFLLQLLELILRVHDEIFGVRVF